MIGGDFTTFDNNRLKLTQFSHAQQVTFFSPSFTTTELVPSFKQVFERAASIVVIGAQLPRGIAINVNSKHHCQCACKEKREIQMRESYRGEQEKHGCTASGDSSGSGVGLGGL